MEEAVGVDMVLLVDLVGEDVDRECVDVLQGIDHPGVEDYVFHRRRPALARVGVQYIDGCTAGRVVDAISLEYDIMFAVARKESDRRRVGFDGVFDQ